MLPILYQGPELILYSYPLLMGLGWGVAYQIYFGLMPSDVPRKFSELLYWGIFLFAWLGSKILFLYTVPQAISPGILIEADFWLGGGFVFFGGFLGALSFLLLYWCFGFLLNERILWPMVPALTLGHAIGRVGCFLAGCCYGAPSKWWWSVHLHGQDRHPTQLIEAMSLMALGTYLLTSKRPKLQLICLYFLCYGAIRLLVEALRGDAIRGLWGPLTPSQWISLLFLLGGWGLFRKFNRTTVSVIR